MPFDKEKDFHLDLTFTGKQKRNARPVGIGVAAALILFIILTMTTSVASKILPMSDEYLLVMIPPAPDGGEALSLKSLKHEIDGKMISDADVKNSVVVLHFWQYRGEPLTEPYGQIGYLDFLNGKRKKLGVKVIGVNIDERFANPQQASAANRSMKSLLEFMKVGYDVATDDGSVLAEFGDPRAVNAPLPLWIVIGHDGVITHYHTGIYDIKPDEGLKQLDDAIVEALRRQKQK